MEKLPGKWSIKLDLKSHKGHTIEENRKHPAIKWFNKKGYNFDGTATYYNYCPSICNFSDKIPKDYTEITLEDFKRLVLKEGQVTQYLIY